MIRWHLHDPSGTLSDYTLRINPNVMDSPYPVRVIEGSNTADGKFRGFGKQPPHDWTFGGFLYDSTQYNQMKAWAALGSRVQLTDHLNRTWDVRIIQFEPVRTRVLRKPWKHEYVVRVTTYKGPL